MSRLDALIAQHPLPTWRIAAWPIMLLIAGLLIWALFARLDEVAVAAGEVVPQTKVKVVQHLEGGIIEAIFVQEGATVRAGDRLVQLDLATAGVNHNELRARLDGEQLHRARLFAETQGAALTLPSDAAARLPDVADAERRAFEARRREISSTLAVVQEQVRQRQAEIHELEAKRRAVTANLALSRERLRLSESLLSEKLMSKMEHLSLKSEVEKLDGEMQTLASAAPRARAAVAEAEQRLKEAADRFRREAQENLGEAESSIARLKEQLVQATDQGRRAEIRSPIDGIVKKLRYNTIGGVVSRGEPIMEIVPTTDSLVVQAKLSPIDRGYVRPGQPALVKISTYDFVRYGGLDGHVIQVAPDSSSDQRGASYFEVIVETERTQLGNAEQPLPISPGMQATVDIHTGTRTVIDYLLSPVLKLRHEALRER